MTETQNIYNEYWKNTWMQYSFKIDDTMKYMLSHIRKGDVVVDIGCGDGKNYSWYVKTLTDNYIGMDISDYGISSFLEMSKSNAIIADCEHKLCIKDNSIDIVLWFANAEHLVYPQKTLKEIKRILKPGGKVIITVPNNAHLNNRLLLLAGVVNPGGSPDKSFYRSWEDEHLRLFTFHNTKNFLEIFDKKELFGGTNNFIFDLPKVGKYFKFTFLFMPFFKYVCAKRPSLFSSTVCAIATK